MNEHTPKHDAAPRPGGLFNRISSVILGGGAPAPEGGAEAPRGSDSDTMDAATLEEVREQLSRGRKVEAIKLYREAASCDLEDAREAVERMAR